MFLIHCKFSNSFVIHAAVVQCVQWPLWCPLNFSYFSYFLASVFPFELLAHLASTFFPSVVLLNHYCLLLSELQVTEPYTEMTLTKMFEKLLS